MPFRLGKSIKVAPGVRLNVSTSGVGMSVPGWRSLLPRGSAPRRSGRTTTRSSVPAAVPGLLAPKGEKELFKALTAQDPEWIVHVGRTELGYRQVAFGYAGVVFTGIDPASARGLLHYAFSEEGDPAQHPFVQKYSLGVQASIAPGIVAGLPFGRDAIGLVLAELHQASGDLQAAIDVVEQLEPTGHAAVSLAELYSHAGRHQQIVELTDGLKNVDDATALLLVYRGVALRELGYHEASREASKEALKTKSRDRDIRHLAISERVPIWPRTRRPWPARISSGYSPRTPDTKASRNG